MKPLARHMSAKKANGLLALSSLQFPGVSGHFGDEVALGVWAETEAMTDRRKDGRECSCPVLGPGKVSYFGERAISIHLRGGKKDISHSKRG